MPGYRYPLHALGKRQGTEVEPGFIGLAEFRKLLARDHSSSDPGPSNLVADALLSSAGETQTTPASRRHSPERAAAAGRRDAGDGPRLELVGGRLIDARGRFNARRRNHFNNGSAA